MSDEPKSDFKAGDPLPHTWCNEVARRLKPTDVRVGGGLTARRGARGQVQLNAIGKMAFVAVANGNITARSGSTAGSGSVTRYQLNISGTYATTGVNYDVWNPSSTTMTSGNGINSGQYCWVEEDDDGNLLVAPLECA